ncbi:MAG: sigma-70 family RNA polymerase sigma factor [Acidimicrobiales bacterium]|nr:sigma-70 family RNA polymerase sigma factor [Acidimicrobiales bacterium]
MDEKVRDSFADRVLVERLIAGDERALGELYDSHSGFVYALALRVIGDPQAAEDVTQEVFVMFWQMPERFDTTRGSLRAFLGTLAHRRAVDHIRREEARRRRETKSTFEPPSVPAVEDIALSSATSREVRKVVNRLPADQRQALELAYFNGYTYRQVANVLGIPEGTAKSRLRLALRRIAEAIYSETSEQWV